MGYKVEKFTRKEDDIEVEDNEVLQELLSIEKEVWLVAKESSVKTQINSHIKVSTLSQKEPKEFNANSLESLKNQSKFYLHHFKLFFIGLQVIRLKNLILISMQQI